MCGGLHVLDAGKCVPADRRHSRRTVSCWSLLRGRDDHSSRLPSWHIPQFARGDERERLKKLAVGAAERDLAGLKAPGGEKVGLTGLHDMIQKGLFGGSMEKNMADVAKNTAEQKTLLKEAISAIKEGHVARAQ